MKAFRIHDYRAAHFIGRSNQFAGVRAVKNAFAVVTKQHRSSFRQGALKSRSQYREDTVANCGRCFLIGAEQLLAMRNKASFCGSRPTWVADQCQPQPVELAAKRFDLFRSFVTADDRQKLHFSPECNKVADCVSGAT